MRIAYRPVHPAAYHQPSPNASSTLSSMPSRVLVLKSRATTVLAVVVGSLIALLFFLSLSPPSMSIVHGVMIDAGSTGTRIHTYIFLRHTSVSVHASQNNSTNGTSTNGTTTSNNTHTQPVFKFRVVHDDYFPIKPGLSAYKDNPDEAARSLLPLLHHAKTRVPAALQASTPVMLRATARLRMLGNASAEAILDAVRATLRASGFRFDADDWASVLSGTEEAVYTWMTVNSLLARDAEHTVGTLELGGGSAQIAFVPGDDDNNMNHTAADGICDFDAQLMSYGGHDLRLYAASHMDYGLQKARSILLSHFKSDGRTHENPCFNAVGTSSGRHNLSVQIPFVNPPANVTVSGSGAYEACQTLVRKTLVDADVDGAAACKCKACTYHGAVQPRAVKEFVAVAFYRERTAAIGMRDAVTAADIDAMGRRVCAMSVQQVKERFRDVPNGAATDLCLDLAYISVHLRHGHRITAEGAATLRMVRRIDGFEVGWCLGAMQQTLARLNLTPI